MDLPKGKSSSSKQSPTGALHVVPATDTANDVGIHPSKLCIASSVAPSGTSEESVIPITDQHDDELDEMLKPSWVSLCIVLLNCSLGVTSFLIVLPTSANYTSSFGINEQLAGLLVGLSPLINGLIQPLLIPIFQRFRLQHVFLANCIITMLGNSLYGLGDITNSFGILLLGRCILGISGGPAFATTYTARATCTKLRTRYMGYTAVSVSSGYVFGPILAFVSEQIVVRANWDSQLINSNTLPGWIVVVLAFFNLLLFIFLFEEPPQPTTTTTTTIIKPSPDGAKQAEVAEVISASSLQQENEQQELEAANSSKTFSATSVLVVDEEEGGGGGKHLVDVALEVEDGLPSDNDDKGATTSFCCGVKMLQIIICHLFIGVTMANTGSFEISLVFRGEEDWDFSISHISLLLAAFNIVTIALSCTGWVERFVANDREGILLCFAGLLLGSPFLFNYNHGHDLSRSAELALVALGGIVLLFSAQTAKGFLFGMASKVPSPEYQQRVVSFMATAYTFGRFAGTLVAPFLFEHSNAYGGFLLGMNSLCCVLFLVFYQHMKGTEEC